MAFSFFKRKGEEPKTLAPPRPVAPKPPAGGSAIHAPAPAMAPLPAEMEMVEFDELSFDGASATAESYSAVEEAAILYANERVTEAISTLLHFIKENADARDLHPWLLLFDLYQLLGMKQQFDELSMDFVVKYERSAPVWEGARAATMSAKPQPKRGMANGVQLKGEIGAAQHADIDRLPGLAEAEGGVKLDLVSASAIDAETASRLAAVLHSIRRGEKRISVAGAKEFAQIIKAQLDGAARQEMRYWALLFELYQILSLQNEFEDAAIDYAVTFELSPPSWEALPETIQTAGAGEMEAQEPVLEAACFMIEGVLGSDCDYKLRDLERHAAARTEIHIDMSNATRVDFVTVGAFIGTLISFNQSGKQVVISGANGMIHALFDVMGVTEYATLIRKKSR
ncbi:MAG: STAS domain-containing protein [Hydrogenophilales bacterium]|nr:STAS domain-containing protein [Hydrogenophilales bacterium]